MATRSFQSIVSSMISYISSKYPRAKTQEGSLINDIVIKAPGQEISKAYTKINSVSEAQSIDTASLDGLISIGANYNKRLKASVAAQGIITFFTRSAPQNDINISSGTIISTRASTAASEIRFYTIRNITMYAILSASYLNPATGYYEISTEIEAVTAGASGIVGSQTITTLVGPVSGIDGCYNENATSGGSDTEDIETFRNRLSLALMGNNIGTSDGLLGIVLANENVTDAVLVGHGEAERDSAGAVDIYIKGSTIQPRTDSFDISLLGSISSFILTKQPIIEASTPEIVYAASGSVPAHSLLIDTGQYAGSILGRDSIIWDSALPEELGTVYVSYSYNALIADLQNLFDQTNTDVLNLNLLIKQAVQTLIDVTVSIKILPGYDSLYVSLAIQTEIASLFNSIAIGGTVKQADVARSILNTAGVADVMLPFTKFSDREVAIVPDSFNDLTLADNSYPTAGDVTINISV